MMGVERFMPPPWRTDPDAILTAPGGVQDAVSSPIETGMMSEVAA
jgi:hypothetical protein